LSIKNFVLACLAAVGALLAVTVILLFVGEWRDYQTARDADQLVELLGATTKISEALAPERGATSVALDGDLAARKTLLDTRAALDAAFDTVGQVAAATPLAEGKEAAETVAKIRATLAIWRSKSDAVMGGDPQQIVTVRKDLIAAMYELLNSASGLTAMLGRHLFALAPQVASPAALAETTWQMRDHAGRISTLYLSGIISAKPFTPELIHDINVADGRIQQLWERLSAVAGSEHSPPGLKDGLAKAQAGFVSPFKPVRERVAKAGLGAGDYDITPAEWRRQTAPMLQAIMLMRDAAIGEARQQAGEKSDHAFRNLILMGLLLAAAAATLAAAVIGINRRVVAPLTALTTLIGEFASGSRDFSVPFADRRDEIGHMAKAIEVLRNKARAADDSAAQEAVAARARDDRRQRVEAITTGFVASIDVVVGGVAAAIDGLRSATDTLSRASDTTTEQSAVVAGAADQASANVQTVAAAAEELANSIQEISRRVAETATATDGAVREAEDTNATVAGLAEAARRIGDVVKLINDIASQTNLLALNATIEAARAGDAGKGFAVVANEVKSLANQTARATDDIQTQVTAIQAETNRAVAAIGGIARTISTVNQFTMGIASAVEEQGAATQEIARNVQQASSGTAEVSYSIGKVLDAARQTGTAASQLAGLAGQLTRESEVLRGNVGSFVTEVKKR